MRTLDALVSRAALEHPDRTCLLAQDVAPLSYRDLDANADLVATRLRAAGVISGDRVGICARKSYETVAALIGAMRVGAAYVPVDVDAPPQRSAGIFSDCAIKALLIGADAAEAVVSKMSADHPLEDVGQLNGLQLFVHRQQPDKCPENTAYILYTSGSTGRPKGVVHTHASALAFVDWCCAEFAPTDADKFSSHAPFHFDLSILDLYVPFKVGAAIRLFDSGESKQPATLATAIESERLTFWYSTPTVLRSMKEFGQLDQRDLSSLRIVCFAGEVFPPRQLKAFAAHVPNALIYNLYGPTETNVCTYFSVESPQDLKDHDEISIGFAASDDELQVLGEDTEPVHPGEEGELVVTGGSVMKGYWNTPDRDKIAFVHLNGKRWYRTGDVVVEDENGALMFRGRRDRMVKRRGYRIELDEIEASMIRHDALSECAAIAAAGSNDEVSIICFCEGSASEERLSPLQLKRFAAKHLPVYMIPDRIVQLPEIPMTSTNKVDYQRLKEQASAL